MGYIWVIELEQHIGSRLTNIGSLLFDEFDIDKLAGGDSEASIKFTGRVPPKPILVHESQSPALGYVWFIKGPDGKIKRWKERIDSSD